MRRIQCAAVIIGLLMLGGGDSGPSTGGCGPAGFQWIYNPGGPDHDGDFRILELTADGSELISDDSWQEPALSPDGTRIAAMQLYYHGNDVSMSRGELVIMDVDGTHRRKPADMVIGSSPKWSPTGDRIAWITASDENEPERLMVVDAHGGEPTEVVTASERFGQFDWSPDGHSLAWTEFGHGAWRNPDTGDEPHDLPGVTINRFVWLDSHELVGVMADGSTDEDDPLARYDIDTGELARWGDGVAFAEQLLRLPDGGVALVRSDETEVDDTTLSVVDADGTDERQVATVPPSYRPIFSVAECPA